MSLFTGNVSNMSTAPEPKPHAQGRAISNTFFVFSHLLIPYLKMIVKAPIVIFAVLLQVLWHFRLWEQWRGLRVIRVWKNRSSVEKHWRRGRERVTHMLMVLDKISGLAVVLHDVLEPWMSNKIMNQNSFCQTWFDDGGDCILDFNVTFKKWDWLP